MANLDFCKCAGTTAVAVFLAFNAVSQLSIFAGGEVSGTRCEDGSYRYMGENSNALFGDGTTTGSSTPAIVNYDVALRDICVGRFFSIGLAEDSTVWAWGQNNFGQLGAPEPAGLSTVPVQVPLLDSVIKIDNGVYHGMALRADSTVWVWGNNDTGIAGDGSVSLALPPQQVPGISGIAKIAAGTGNCFAITEEGLLYAWGVGTSGELGTINIYSVFTPTLITSFGTVEEVWASWAHTLVRKTDGTIWGVGQNNWGQLAGGFSGFNQLIPIQSTGIDEAIDISLGTGHGMALMPDGSVKCWGYNGNGQVGNGTFEAVSNPVAVAFDVEEIAAGDFHSAARHADGNWSGWGKPYPLGIDALNNVLEPTAIIDPCSVVTVEQINQSFNWSVSPNPARERITLALESAPVYIDRVEVLDLSGRIVLTELIRNQVIRVEVNTIALPSGMYLVRVISEKSPVTYRFCIE
jgi:alpha-tubulin suppressor-like RCC1 family protein